MALPKLFNLITWHNNTTPAINEDNLNAMSQAIDGIDDRVIGLAGTIMEDVPQIQEDIEELEEDFALIDEKIADATSEANRATTEANRATTKANEAAASVISAGNKALISEGYAKGTQNGTPVGSSSPYYHNNAEYFKEQARSFTPTGYQDLVDDVAEAQEAITDIEGEKVSSNDAYVLRQCKGNMVDLDLVGGSVAWNQLLNMRDFTNTTGGDSVVSQGTASTGTVRITSDGNNTETDAVKLYSSSTSFENTTFAGHKVLIDIGGKNPDSSKIRQKFYVSNSTGWGTTTNILNDSSFAPIIASIPSDKPYFYWYLNIKASTTCDFSLKPQIIDLTQLFGSTIADYIYALETATAGAGVAWFRKYFPNVYYAYNPGEIKSVNPSYRKVVGKNLFRNNAVSQTSKGITFDVQEDGTVIANGTATGDWAGITLAQYYPIKKGRYILSGVVTASSSNRISVSIPGQSEVATYGVDTPFDVENDTYLTCNCYIRNSGFVANNYEFKPMICLATVTDATYEPYKEYTFPFDSSKQLRGVPKLVDNKLSYDGDIYTADGSITRKYGIVDLGSLTWNYTADWNGGSAISTPINSINSANPSNIVAVNAISAKYGLAVSREFLSTNPTAKALAVNESKSIIVRDSAYSDAETFKTAMNGVYLVYELATPTTESAAPFQNPQRAFIDGIEEFVDAGVTASTRDVSIPVGNVSEYNTSVVLPAGQDYTDGAMEILKEIVASSSDFADFKTKVAAL